MITPDTKNWTWVLEQTCEECGFDASRCTAREVPSLIRANATAWQQLFDRGEIHPGRPTPTTWSSLEYAAHVRDVYRRYTNRIALMLDVEDPMFENWDQDASANDDRYEEQAPVTVISELQGNAAQLADRLDDLTPPEWLRRGRRSDGANFSVDSISRYMIHDTIHHVVDVTRSRSI